MRFVNSPHEQSGYRVDVGNKIAQHNNKAGYLVSKTTY